MLELFGLNWSHMLSEASLEGNNSFTCFISALSEAAVPLFLQQNNRPFVELPQFLDHCTTPISLASVPLWSRR